MNKQKALAASISEVVENKLKEAGEQPKAVKKAIKKSALKLAKKLSKLSKKAEKKAKKAVKDKNEKIKAAALTHVVTAEPIVPA